MDKQHKNWEEIHHRLRALEAADLEDEAKMLTQAYEALLSAYQEARTLNDEMEMLISETLTS